MNKIIIMLILCVSVAGAGDLGIVDDLIIHLDAASITGLNDGDDLILWNDIAIGDSVNGDLSPANSWSPATYIADGINGNPVVDISAADAMVSADNIQIPDISAGLTVIMVATGDKSSENAERALHFGNNAGLAGEFLACDLSTSSGGTNDGSGARFNNGKALVNANNPLSGGFHIIGYQIGHGDSYSQLKYYVDQPTALTLDNIANGGNTISLQSEGNILALGTGVINGSLVTSDSYTGSIAELLIYNRQLTQIEIESVYGYLQDRYFNESLVIHLDAGSIEGLADGDSISKWPDTAVSDSVVGDVNSVSGWDKPVYKSDILNGRPVVRLENGAMLGSDLFSLANADKGLTLFMVATGDTSGQTGERAMQIGQVASNGGKCLGIDLSTTTTGNDGGSGGRFNGGKALVRQNNPLSTDFHIITAQIAQNGSYSSLLYAVDDMVPEVFDNVANGGTSLSLLATNNKLTVGTGIDSSGNYMASDNYTGDIAEIIVYNDILDANARQEVFDMLYQKYFYSIINVSPSGIVLQEGQSVTLDISLEVEPADEVTLSFSDISDHPQLECDIDSLTFNSENWSQSQQVVLTAIDDIVLEAEKDTGKLQITAESADSKYDGTVCRKSISIMENECGRWAYTDGDYNEDCKVDIKDFAVISRYWLWCDPMKDDNCYDLR